MTKEQFIEKLSNFSDKVNSDVTTRKAAEDIYDKYLSSLISNALL